MYIALLKYLDTRRIFNLCKIGGSYFLSRLIRKPVIWGFPAALSVEPTNLCNLACPECPAGNKGLSRPAGLMSFEKFMKIIDGAADYCIYLQLFFQGEPFLNPELPKMLQYARTKRIFTSVSTNGTLLNQKTISEILKHPPDKLIFSIDGTNEDSYASYRVNGAFGKVLTAVKMLSIEKKSAGLKLPQIEFQMIIMKQNEYEIEKAKQVAVDCGADVIKFKSMQVYDSEGAEKFLPVNPEFRRYDIDGENLRMKKTLKNRCFALWNTAVITWDGRMVPCCFDKNADHQLGIINGLSLLDLWHSIEFNSFRQNVLKNRTSIPLCNNCSEGINTDLMKERLT